MERTKKNLEILADKCAKVSAKITVDGMKGECNEQKTQQYIKDIMSYDEIVFLCGIHLSEQTLKALKEPKSEVLKTLMSFIKEE